MADLGGCQGDLVYIRFRTLAALQHRWSDSLIRVFLPSEGLTRPNAPRSWRTKMAAEDFSETKRAPKHRENIGVNAKDANGGPPRTRKVAMARSCGLGVGLLDTLETPLIMIYQ